jgi:hypothetical protein
MRDPELRRQMLLIAARYEVLAERYWWTPRESKPMNQGGTDNGDRE